MYINNSNKAFSLVELIIVIAIVGILSALAVPAYNAYQLKVKYSTIWPLIDEIKSRAIIYEAKNGAWPDAFQIGYTTQDGVDGDEFENINAINPYITQIEMISNGGTMFGGCTTNTIFMVNFYADPSLGLGNNYIGFVFVGPTDGGSYTTFCVDTLDGGSTWGNAYLGSNCDYTAATGVAFLNAACR